MKTGALQIAPKPLKNQPKTPRKSGAPKTAHPIQLRRRPLLDPARLAHNREIALVPRVLAALTAREFRLAARPLLLTRTVRGFQVEPPIRRRPHKSTTLIDVRLAPTSGAKADISLPPLSAMSRHFRRTNVMECEAEARRYSALMLAPRMIGHHLSISALWWA